MDENVILEKLDEIKEEMRETFQRDENRVEN